MSKYDFVLKLIESVQCLRDWRRCWSMVEKEACSTVDFISGSGVAGTRRAIAALKGTHIATHDIIS